MKQLFIDTNVYVAFKRNDPAIVDLLRHVESIAVTTVVLGELLAGFRGGIREAENRKELDLFLDSPRVEFLALDESCADYFALVFNALNPTTQLMFVHPVRPTFFADVTNMNGDSWLVSSGQAPASFQYRTFSSVASLSAAF